MKIAIEAQRIFRKEKHGMDYVALETIRELQKIDQQNEYFILVSPGDDVCLQESANMHIVTVNWPSYPLWEQIGLPPFSWYGQSSQLAVKTFSLLQTILRLYSYLPLADPQ